MECVDWREPLCNAVHRILTQRMALRRKFKFLFSFWWAPSIAMLLQRCQLQTKYSERQPFNGQQCFNENVPRFLQEGKMAAIKCFWLMRNRIRWICWTSIIYKHWCPQCSRRADNWPFWSADGRQLAAEQKWRVWSGSLITIVLLLLLWIIPIVDYGLISRLASNICCCCCCLWRPFRVINSQIYRVNATINHETGHFCCCCCCRWNWKTLSEWRTDGHRSRNL